MDRRYSANRTYDGTRASTSSQERSQSLVRAHLARARQTMAQAKSYGGSTGGSSSIDQMAGLSALLNRNEILKDEREAFRQAGSGVFGARTAMAEARGYL